jgi:hypothetical protein
MKRLSKAEDPTSFFNLIRQVASDLFGDPRGVIQGQGRQPNLTKAGPGRRRAGPWNGCQHGAKGLNNRVIRRGH